MLASLDFEFRFPLRDFDWTTKAEIVCGVLLLEDGKRLDFDKTNWQDLHQWLEKDTLTIAVHHGHGAEGPVLKQLGLPWPERWLDTELLERTLDIANKGFLHYRYKLLDCMQRRNLPCRSAVEKEFMQNQIARGDFSVDDLPTIRDYCADDCKDTLTLAKLAIADFKKLSVSVQRIYVDLFQPFLLKSADIASQGLCFDRDSYEQIIDNQDQLLTEMQRKIKEQGFLGRFIWSGDRLNSAAQNHAVLHTLEDMQLFKFVESLPVYRQDWGKPYDQQRRSLAGLFKKPPPKAPSFIHTAVAYHELLNLCQTDWLSYIDCDLRIRPNIKFPGASSTRVMQFGCHPLRLPKFGRPLIHASPGMVLYEFDFKAQEIGLASAYYNDQTLLNIYNTYNTHTHDLYATIGKTMGEFPFELADWKQHKSVRDDVKVAILAISYGGGINALRENLNCSEKRAREIYRNFWNTFGDLKTGRSLYYHICEQSGYATNVIGFPRKFERIRFTAYGPKDQTLSYLNYPIQSAGVAVLMYTLNEMPSGIKVVLTTHDGLLVEGPLKDAPEIEEAVVGAMRRAMGKLFPKVAVHVDVQKGFRYHKDNGAVPHRGQDSLHKFCASLGLTLKSPVTP